MKKPWISRKEYERLETALKVIRDSTPWLSVTDPLTDLEAEYDMLTAYARDVLLRRV